ncbi:hypothetical protein [Pseudorhodoplanes sp.]|uniref:hypothetical protein n=1 Tax=Pseudorhodoplanes sp. TaxID=1934341 RepID=UPI00391C5B8D
MSDDGPKSDILAAVRVREVVGLVKSRDTLDRLVDELTNAGFDRADIDLMASRTTIMRELKVYYNDPVAAAEVSDAPRRDLIKTDDKVSTTALVFGTLVTIGTLGATLPIVASGGALAAVAAAALAGGATGAGLAGILRTRLLSSGDGVDLEDELRLGGIVVLVRVRNPEAEVKAQQIMRRHGVEKIHVHEVELKKTLADIPLSSINPDPWLGEDHSLPR